MENKASYRFLYREALIRTVQIELDTTLSTAQQFQDILPQLLKQKLDLLLDQKARQAVIFPIDAKKNYVSNTTRLQGIVVDAKSGERLPFATVQWEENEHLRGVITNLSGNFTINKPLQTDTLNIKVSYIGYEPYFIDLPLKTISDTEVQLSVRLNPEITTSQEVVVEGNYMYTDNLNTQQSIELMGGIILGEENTIGALQVLPSVQVNSAMNSGLNVRGSAADGFSVFLDGIRVYNQSHFFGLFDNFNASAIQYASLYYDVIPASIEASAGGVLALNTRNGSLNEAAISGGVSNSSAQFTWEKPIVKGKSSILLSVKHSLLNEFAPVNNTNLVYWGLDVNREKASVIEGLRFSTDETQLITLNQASAHFGDIHLGYYQEQKNGGRFHIKGYYGFDDMRSDYLKLTELFDANSLTGRRLTDRSTVTENLWNNAKVSAHYDQSLGQNTHYFQSVGYSMFKSEFLKEDFGFININQQSGALERIESPLQIQSIINDLAVNQRLEWLGAKSSFTLGLDYHYLLAEYFEDSIDKSRLFIQQKAHKIDSYASSYLQLGKNIALEQGLRLTYFEPDQSFRWSPRFKLLAEMTSSWSASFGYSLHNQFMNRVRFSNVLSSDVWIIADREQPPTNIENWSAGLYYQPNETFSFQIEAYNKTTKNLRLHELDWYAIPNSFVSVPWFYSSSGEAKGLEFSVIKNIGPLSLQQSYTLSESTIQNDELNQGKPFYADWHRRHQAVSLVKLTLGTTVNLRFTQTIASGNPNRLFLLQQDQESRLGTYIRSDIGIDWLKKFSFGQIHLLASIYNLTDRQNSWYREIGILIDPSTPNRIFTEAPVEVYDLGIQPSLSMKVRF